MTESGAAENARQQWLWRLAVLLLVAVAIAAVFSFYLHDPLSNTVFGVGDHWLYFGPHHFVLDHALHEGELPLWNPLILCGTPYAANPQSLTFYPPNLLRSALTFGPTPMKTYIGLGLLVWAHILMAGLATFGFARSQGLNRGASLVAAFGFIFGAHFVGRAMVHWMFVAIASWLPILLWLLHQALTQKTLGAGLRSALAAGLVFGVSTLGGFPQLTLYMALALGTYGVLYRVVHVTGERPVRQLASFAWRDAVKYAVLFGVGGLTAAAMLLPASELAQYSGRTKGNPIEREAKSEYDQFRYVSLQEYRQAEAWAEKGLPKWLGVQLVRAKNIGRNAILYSGAIVKDDGSQEFRNFKLAGVGILFLAIAAFTHARRRTVLLWAGLFVVLLDCSLGPPFPIARLVQAVAPFRLGVSERACMIACFPLAMLAAYGVEAATVRLQRPGLTLARSLAFLFAGCVILVPLYRMTHPHAVIGDLSSFVVIAPATLLVALVFAGRIWPARFWYGLFPLLIMVELAAWNHAVLRENFEQWPYRGSQERFQGQRTFSLANARGTFNDAKVNPEAPEPSSMNQRMYMLAPVSNGYDPLHLARIKDLLTIHQRDDAYTRLFYPFELTLEQQRGNLLLKRPFWLAKEWVAGALPPPDALYPVGTTVFLPEGSGTPVPELSRDDLCTTSLSGTIFTRLLPLPDGGTYPLALTGRGGPVMLSFREVEVGPQHTALVLRYACDTRAAIDFRFVDPATGHMEFGRHAEIGPTQGVVRELQVPLPAMDRVEATATVYFHTGGGALDIELAELRADLEDEADKISIDARSMNRVDLTIGPLSEPRLLVFVDAYYPGWRAWVGDEPAEVLLANDAFKAIVVPAGTHAVRFEFRPMRVYLGMAISGLTVLAALGVLLVSGRRRV